MWWKDKTILTYSEVLRLRKEVTNLTEFWQIMDELDFDFHYSLNPRMADFMLELSIMDMRGLTKSEMAENPVAVVHARNVPYYALDELNRLCMPLGLAYIKDRNKLTLIGRKRYAKFAAEIIKNISMSNQTCNTAFPDPVGEKRIERTKRWWKNLLEAEALAAESNYKIEIIKYELAEYFWIRVALSKIMHKIAELQPNLRDWDDKSTEIILKQHSGQRLGGIIPVKSE